jgi:hypothetical protein
MVPRVPVWCLWFLVWVLGWCGWCGWCGASVVLGDCGDLAAGFGAISCAGVVAEICGIVGLTLSYSTFAVGVTT